MSAPARHLPGLAAVVLTVSVLCAPIAAVSAESQTRRVVRAVPAAAVQSQDTQNRNVRVHNQTGWTMTALSASSGGGWGPDLLGSAALASGRSEVVRIDDGSGACRYSLRAQFDNGETLERGGINACQIADYYFTR